MGILRIFRSHFEILKFFIFLKTWKQGSEKGGRSRPEKISEKNLDSPDFPFFPYIFSLKWRNTQILMSYIRFLRNEESISRKFNLNFMITNQERRIFLTLVDSLIIFFLFFGSSQSKVQKEILFFVESV